MENWIFRFCQAMPKVELHLHLDGALTPETALELLENGKGSYRDMFKKLVIPGKLASQKQLLNYFNFPLELLQTKQAIYRITQELIISKAADNVRYCEIRWAPSLHTKKGVSIREVVKTVLKAAKELQSYTDIYVNFIAVGLRGEPLENNLKMLYEIDGLQKEGLVGVDFAGQEETIPDPVDQLSFFEKARELGFKITLHCGELPNSAPIINRAVEFIAPQRIAHGAGAVEDPKLCQRLKKMDIQLDLCPVSNIQAGLYKGYESYPAIWLHREGVPISISTDSPVLHNISLSEEYARMVAYGGFSPAELWQVNIGALNHSFADKKTKELLLDEFKCWAKNIIEIC